MSLNMNIDAEDRWGLYGLVAEFETPEALLEAARQSYNAGYRKMDAYTPMPVEGLADAVGFPKNRVPLVVMIGAILGGSGAFYLCYWMTVIAYAHNVGGRPMNSWPAYIPITFEGTVLIAAFSAIIGMLALNGMPTPYHPVFNLPRFQLASRDRFFLCIEARDQKFSLDETRAFLENLKPLEVSEVAK